MQCRSTERREWIVDNYNVVPEAHIQLLKGMIKHSDAGGNIKNDYYIFKATHKQDGHSEIIQCGIAAARDFLRLLRHDGLPIFNPLHVEGEAGGDDGRNPHGEEHGERIARRWNLVAKQLYNAIMWVILFIDAKPDTDIFNIKNTVYRYGYKEPFDREVVGVNTIIRKTIWTITGRTLTEKIDEIRTNNNIRNEMCQFDLLTEWINNLEIQSFF